MFAHPARLITSAVVAAALTVGAICLLVKLRAPAPPPQFSIVRRVATIEPAPSAPEKLNPNRVNPDGTTPLVIAVQQHDAAAIANLLGDGADVDFSDREGVTPIMAAAENGDVDSLRNFVERSRKLDAVDNLGRSAVQHAIVAQQRETLDLLLPGVADITRQSADGRDLLSLASETNNPQIIASVLSREPDDLKWTPATRSALKLALASNDPDFLRLVLRKHATPPTVEGGTTPLLAEAIVSDDASLFNALLAAGADPNTMIPLPAEKAFTSQIRSEDLRGYVHSDDGMTVLMIAAGLGKTEYVRALLNGGADRNRATKHFKMLALYFAAHNAKPECIQTLLGRGPTPEELRIEVSLATQKAVVFKAGVQILQTSISTGREGYATQAGEYVITDKDKNHRSSIYKVDMPYFMRLNCRDFGLHAGVVRRTPASHGCIRLPPDVAAKLFTEIPVGTVVTIN